MACAHSTFNKTILSDPQRWFFDPLVHSSALQPFLVVALEIFHFSLLFAPPLSRTHPSMHLPPRPSVQNTRVGSRLPCPWCPRSQFIFAFCKTNLILFRHPCGAPQLAKTNSHLPLQRFAGCCFMLISSKPKHPCSTCPGLTVLKPTHRNILMSLVPKAYLSPPLCHTFMSRSPLYFTISEILATTFLVLFLV